MTTIVVCKKSRTMAADSYVSGGPGFKTQKIFEVDGKLVGFSGNLTHALKFIEWLKHGSAINLAYDKDEHTFEALVLGYTLLEYFDNELVPAIIQDPYYAIGSGAAFALGAMEAGASPKRAVEIACRRDDASRGPIIVRKLKP